MAYQWARLSPCSMIWLENLTNFISTSWTFFLGRQATTLRSRNNFKAWSPTMLRERSSLSAKPLRLATGAILSSMICSSTFTQTSVSFRSSLWSTPWVVSIIWWRAITEDTLRRSWPHLPKTSTSSLLWCAAKTQNWLTSTSWSAILPRSVILQG